MDCHGTLANSGGDAFYAASSAVANGENAGNACLKQHGCSQDGPTEEVLILIKIGPGHYESLFVQNHRAFQPIRAGRCSGHNKHMPDRIIDTTIPPVVSPVCAFEVCNSVEPNNSRQIVHFDLRILLNPSDQILRH